MRFRVTVLAAVVSLIAIAAGTVGAVIFARNDSAVPLVTAMFGMIAGTIPALLALLKIEDTNNKVTNGYMDNKIKSNVKVAMAERAEEFQLGIIEDERKEDDK